MSSKAFTAKTFTFLHQVNTDSELPASDMKVAMAFTWYFNEDEGGQARVGCGTIGKRIGLSETTVVRSLHRLEARGHIRVVWGKQGRGHPNHVWMLLKPAPAQVSEGEKPAPAQAGKPAPVKIKPAPAQENLLKNHTGASKEAPCKRERENLLAQDSDPGGGAAPLMGAPAGKEETEPSEITEPARLDHERAWRELRGLWDRPYPEDLQAAKRAFDTACAEGAEPEGIVAGARTWVTAFAVGTAGDGMQFLPKLVAWLDAGKWEHDPPARAKRRTRQAKRRRKFDMAKYALEIGGYVEAADGSMVWGGAQ
jgi:hypothetical protein